MGGYFMRFLEDSGAAAACTCQHRSELFDGLLIPINNNTNKYGMPEVTFSPSVPNKLAACLSLVT